MNSIAIVIPYFGKLPEHYKYWKQSVYKNESIDFFIITDEKQITSKNNLEVINMSFQEYVQKIQEAIPFKIKCDSPYKLCDYKPTIGKVWHDMLADYDFWGFCDMDLIFGDIRHFITEEILNTNEKIFTTAHFSLYRNSEKMNCLFLNNGDYPEYNAEEAFSTNEACYFDEFRGMELKCIRNQVSVYHNTKIFLDIEPSKFDFKNRDGQKVYLIWKEGKLSALNRDSIEELLYVHFQKRHMICEEGEINQKCFIMQPNFFDNTVSRSIINDGNRMKIYAYQVKYYINRISKNLKDYSICGMLRRKRRMKEIDSYRKKLVFNKSGFLN
ncbi:MAG: hypothetical protein PHD56_11505 [Anaerostipes sp.]|nr:hypothetical protein [Anaerostipes sp.]